MSQKSDTRKHLAAVDQNTVNLDPRKKKTKKKNHTNQKLPQLLKATKWLVTLLTGNGIHLSLWPIFITSLLVKDFKIDQLILIMI